MILGPKCEAKNCAGRAYRSVWPPHMPGFVSDHYYECLTCGAPYDDDEFEELLAREAAAAKQDSEAA